MSVMHPIAASGPRTPDKPKRIPKPIRDALLLMVYGKPDDPDQAPLGFIDAAKEQGVKPDVMRRWLDRPEVRRFLTSERRAFRAAICAGNEAALQRVRDTSENGMAVIGSVRTLEQLEHAASERTVVAQPAPGIVLVIAAPSRVAPLAADTIEAAADRLVADVRPAMIASASSGRDEFPIFRPRLPR